MADEQSRAADLECRLDPRGSGSGLPARPEGNEEALALLAIRMREGLTPPAPRAAFIATARRRLVNRLPARAAPRQQAYTGAVRRLAFATVSVLLAFTIGTAGVAYAAQEALPGEALYGVKRGIEAARWSLTTAPQAQAELLSQFASERVLEVQALAEAGRDSLVGVTLEDYEQTLDQLQSVAGHLPQDIQAKVLAQAEEQVKQDVQVLEGLRLRVPARSLPAIERAVERSSRSQKSLEQIQQGESPSDAAPEQDKPKEHGPKRTPGPPDGKGKP